MQIRDSFVVAPLWLIENTSSLCCKVQSLPQTEHKSVCTGNPTVIPLTIYLNTSSGVAYTPPVATPRDGKRTHSLD